MMLDRSFLFSPLSLTIHPFAFPAFGCRRTKKAQSFMGLMKSTVDFEQLSRPY
jgi:hypothetical protein